MKWLNRIGGPATLAYALALACSAGLLGLLLRQLFTLLGFVPSHLSGLWVIAGAASTYAALEFLFLSIMRAYRPTHSRTTLVTETISHAATIIFIPYMLRVPVPWPNATLEKAEPIIYIGAFLALHSFLKLATFYASLEGAPASRYSSVGWLAGSGGFVVLALVSFSNWEREAEAARSVASIEVATHRAGHELAQGRVMIEGAALRATIEPAAQQTLSFGVANLTEAEGDQNYEKIYLRVEMFGDADTAYWTSVPLREDGWAEMRIPATRVPAGLREYEVRWTREAEPNWQAILGLRPIVYNVPEAPGALPPPPAKIVLSGPHEYRERTGNNPPNVLVLIIDGLAANHLSILGYRRETTPSIDQLGYEGAVFPNAYAPQAESLAVVRSLLGARPQVSESTFPVIGLLAERHYATAAFIEEGNRDLHRSFADDFDLVHVQDPNMSSADAPGSRLTLERARTWIDLHKEVPFFCLVRVRELEALTPRERYDDIYEEDGVVREVDLFDNALFYLDTQIGALLKHMRDRSLADNTIIVLTSTYGYEFALGASGKRLSTQTDRVPLIIHSPGASVRRSPERAGPADIATTLAELVGVSSDAALEGRNLLR